MSLITLTDVSKHYGAELILDGVSLRVERGDHTGLVGTNGAGKSTILRIMARTEEPEGGSVSYSRGLRVAYLPQEPEFNDEHTLYEAMLETFRETIDAQERLRDLESEMSRGTEDGSLIEEYGLLQAIVEHTGYHYEEQIERVLTGLDLPRDLWSRPVNALSGGQRTRANLGRTLLQDADVLLLDEPTNHLDIPAVEWLEGYLRDLKRSFVIVAHDRYLLDRVTNRTLELSQHHVTLYDAPYGRYLELRAERMERQRLEYEAQQQHIARTEDFIRRYGAGQRYKEARGRQKRLDRLERVERPHEEETVRLGLRRAGRTGDMVLEARSLVVGYGRKPLLRLPEELTVQRGAHIAIIGPNGSGKTTLLRTLVGALPAVSGTFRWGARTTAGYYSQTLGQLDDSASIFEEVQRARSMSEEEARGFLGRFLFTGDDVFKRVGVLSGGERSRVALARLILEEPNVLVLDEPTNHLDIASRDALQHVLHEFGGTLLFVSHDRFLIDSLAEQLWVVGDGRVTRYSGTYSDFVAGTARSMERSTGETGSPPAQLRETPEERVTRLEDEALNLATRLAESGTSVPVAEMADLMDQYGVVLERLQEAEHAWLQSVRKQIRAS